ncbi:MAG: hypothetical protein ABEK29_11100, partial [Bradymonadaceae bacterium]
TCATDQNTTYDGSDFAKSGQGCSSGDMVTGIDSSGNVTCATDQDTDTHINYTMVYHRCIGENGGGTTFWCDTKDVRTGCVLHEDSDGGEHEELLPVTKNGGADQGCKFGTDMDGACVICLDTN